MSEKIEDVAEGDLVEYRFADGELYTAHAALGAHPHNGQATIMVQHTDGRWWVLDDSADTAVTFVRKVPS